MRVQKTEAIVVRRRNFGETDRILTVFTRNHGLLSIKAKGVRNISSKRAPHVELLNLSILSIYSGRSLPILTEAHSINTFQEIKKDLSKVGTAFHVCELINELCPPHQENRTVFSLILDTLERIKLSSNPAEAISNFEIELLTLLGFWNKTNPPAGGENIHFVIENILEKKLKTARILPLFTEY